MPKAGQSIKPCVKLPRDPAGCWEWLGVINASSGAPMKQFCGKAIPATRWIWMQLFGPIPDGLVIAHTCGNKTCINPAHLRCCTQAAANREGAHVTLTPDDVREIRAAKQHRLPSTANLLAERFGVRRSAITEIWRGNTWARAKPNRGPRHKQL